MAMPLTQQIQQFSATSICVCGFWHFRTFVCDRKEWLWQLTTCVKDLRPADLNASWGLLNLIGGRLVKRLMRKKSLMMPCPTVCCNFLHRNVLFVPAPTERVWTMGIFSSTTCMRKSCEKKGKERPEKCHLCLYKKLLAPSENGLALL